MITVNKERLENLIKLLSRINVMVYLFHSMDVIGRVESCQAVEWNHYFKHSIDLLEGKRYQFRKIDSDQDNDGKKLNENDMFIESDATKYAVKGNIAIICTGDDHN